MPTYADLLCRLLDELDEVELRRHADAWQRDSRLRSLSLGVTQRVEAGDHPPGRMYTEIVNGGERQPRIFAAVVGIDRAFRRVNPAFAARGTRVPPGLVALEAHVNLRGRLDGRVHDGALLPRLTLPRDVDAPMRHKRDLLQHVQRVPEAIWRQVDHQVFPPSRGIGRRFVGAGLEIDCVPVIADADELAFETDEVDGRRVYRLRPRDLTATLDRIPDIVAALDERGARIAVAPEATLSPRLLRAWQEALRARRPANLRIVAAGTGDIGGTGPRPANAAVLLDGRNGNVLGAQRKLFGFDMDAEVIDRWKLASRLGAGPVPRTSSSTSTGSRCWSSVPCGSGC